MFEKYKERFDKLEEDHETVRKVHEHVVKYQVVYASLGGSAITLVGVKLFGKPQVIVKSTEALPAIVNTINNTPIFNNTVNNGGHMRKIVRCIETDEMWPSMTKAAEAAGHTLHAMSKHIHGENEHLDGLHYVIEGLAAN